jgi:hypothetical protein
VLVALRMCRSHLLYSSPQQPLAWWWHRSQVMQSAAESALGGPVPQHTPGRLANVSQVHWLHPAQRQRSSAAPLPAIQLSHAGRRPEGPGSLLFTT